MGRYGKTSCRIYQTSIRAVIPNSLHIRRKYFMSRSVSTAAISKIASAPFDRALYICHLSMTNSLQRRGHCIHNRNMLILRTIGNSIILRFKEELNVLVPSLLRCALSQDSQSFPVQWRKLSESYRNSFYDPHKHKSIENNTWKYFSSVKMLKHAAPFFS